MNLDLFNNIVNDAKKTLFLNSFLDDLQNYLKGKEFEHTRSSKEDIQLFNPTNNQNKIITQYRDKMLLERKNILNNYAKETIDKGDMYYIYGKNSKMENGYNLCLCKEEYSHLVIEENINNLPSNSQIGTVLRKNGNSYEVDKEATFNIQKSLDILKETLLEEQTQFLESQRIEDHIYEVSEVENDRIWLYDITNDNGDCIEEIDFPIELLNNAEEGNLFIYQNGEYQKYENDLMI